MDIELDEFDFGFSSVSEEDLLLREKEAEDRARKEAEGIIKQQQEESTSALNEVTATANEYRDRMLALKKAIMPLLKNLSDDSDDKPYIYWPDRKKKMQEFIARLDAITNT
jgi:hypothetical protein